jgi:hypothetical protein
MMQNVFKEFIDSLIEAEKSWSSADHLVYVTLPVVHDPKLLIRSLEYLHKSSVILISSILKFEYLYKRVVLSKNHVQNLDIFFNKCSLKYGLGKEDSENIRKLMLLGRKHRESGLEFSKSGKIIILDDNMGMTHLTVEIMKKYLQTIKKLLENTNKQFRSML